jgi:hypothetical protein
MKRRNGGKHQKKNQEKEKSSKTRINESFEFSVANAHSKASLARIGALSTRLRARHVRAEWSASACKFDWWTSCDDARAQRSDAVTVASFVSFRSEIDTGVRARGASARTVQFRLALPRVSSEGTSIAIFRCGQR